MDSVLKKAFVASFLFLLIAVSFVVFQSFSEEKFNAEAVPFTVDYALEFDGASRDPTIRFSIQTTNTVGIPLSDVLVGVIPSYDPNRFGSVVTGSDGTALYSDVAPPVGAHSYRFIASKVGYKNGYLEKTVVIGGCLDDADCDGFVYEKELLFGTDPGNYYDNPATMVFDDFYTSCGNPMTWLLGGVNPLEKQQIQDNLEQLNSEQLELLSNPISANSLNSQELLTSFVPLDVQIQSESIPLKQVFENNSELESFSKGTQVVILLYDSNKETLRIYSIASNCTGLFLGFVDGTFKGAKDDLDFAQQVLNGALSFIYRQDQVTQIASGVIDIVRIFPQALEHIGDALGNAVIDIYKVGTTRNPANPVTQRLEYRAFQVGYVQGFIGGYVIEQAVLVGKIADAIKALKIVQKIDKFTDLIRIIGNKFGYQTATLLQRLEWTKPIIEAGEKAATGLGRITKALGNDAEKLTQFFESIPEPLRIVFSEKVEGIATRLGAASDTILSKLLNKRGYQTVIANYSEEIGEKVGRIAGTSTLEWSDRGITGIAEIGQKESLASDTLIRIDTFKNTKGIDTVAGDIGSSISQDSVKGYKAQLEAAEKLKTNGNTIKEFEYANKKADIYLETTTNKKVLAEVKNENFIAMKTPEIDEVKAQLQELVSYVANNPSIADEAWLITKQPIDSKLLIEFENIGVKVRLWGDI